ncbi:TRAP transporter small permease [Castellaniella sp.]|uniref:TRAP transporter small permease n=1 Tax=Castellaniella sp. TaxID=1955812 RepID=UPI002AFFAFBD|nr:TRAP transporter small permease [Castellaniella sp.]
MAESEPIPTPRDGSATRRWLGQRANDFTVAVMAVMFVSFLLQIVFRYALDRPLGWTEEITVLCWVWVVLWGQSFIITDADEVRFDILYNIVPAPVRRIFTVLSSLALVVLMALSLPATWKYVTFMHREHSAYLKIPFDYLYSIYVLFAVVCIVRQARVAWRACTSSEDPAKTFNNAAGDRFE